MEIVKPPALQPGDTIGIVSPSAGLAARFPHRVARGRAYLESLGFRTVVAEHALGHHGYVSGTPEERAADLHAMFADDSVRAIVATIGGNHACHLLPLLDYDLIASHPKILLGLSDITVLNAAIHERTGLVTFNGPTLMTGLAEYPRTLPYTEEYLLKALTRPRPIGRIAPASGWTDEFLDWERQVDLTRPRQLHPSAGWTWLRGGRGAGPLVGGCLESLNHLRGTRYWPHLDGALLFLETSETHPSPADVDAWLMDYDNMGVLDAINGLLVARPYGYTDDERRALHEVIVERTRRYGYPVVADVDCGHSDPVLTLPIGCQAELDAAAERFAIVEAAVV